MTFAKLSDDFVDQCECLSDEAMLLHACGIVWSAKKLMDCRVPKAKLVPGSDQFRHPEAAPELCAVGYWVDEGDHYRIIHQARYQRTREQELRFQESRRENGRKGGRPRKTDLPPATTRERQWDKPGTYEKPSSFSGTGNLRGSGTGSGKGTLRTTQGEVKDQTRPEDRGEVSPSEVTGLRDSPPLIPSSRPALDLESDPWPVEDPPECPWCHGPTGACTCLV